jgi:predicted Zn-dependent protease
VGYAPKALALKPNGVPAHVGEPWVVRVRVYAAEDYRRVTRQWHERFKRVLARVSAATASWPGVRFELVETRPWERQTAEAPIAALYKELVALDKGDDVDLVVGLAGAVPAMPDSLHQIGWAQLLSKHAVIRGLHDLAEYQVVQRHFDEMMPGEREQVVSARKAHKELVVFLHEWAHTLGLVHAQRTGSIMNPQYSNHQTSFSESDADMIAIALAERRAGKPPSAAREPLRAYVEKTRDPDWDPRDRESILAFLRGRPQADHAQELDESARTALSKAQARYEARDYADALEELAKLEPGHESHPVVAIFACELRYRNRAAGTTSPEALAACEHAAQLNPRDPALHNFVGDLRLCAQQDGRARASLLRADELLASGEGNERTWADLAHLYIRANLPTLAERAAAHAQPDAVKETLAWVARLRRRYALPADAFADKPEEEATYIRALDYVRVALVEKKSAALASFVADVRRQYPSLPGPALADCWRGQARACEAVLARVPDSTNALVGLAALDEVAGRTARAAARLQRVLALDPEEREAWHMLARVLRTRHDGAALATLGADYERRFKEPLRPPSR